MLVALEVVCNEKQVRSRSWHTYRSLTVAIEVCLLFYFPVVLFLNIFPFPPSKSKLLGDFLMNRQNVATWYMSFFSFTKLIAYRHTELSCVT